MPNSILMPRYLVLPAGLSLLLCSLALFAAAAAIPSALRVKDAALARAAPALAALTPGTALAEGDDIAGIIILGGSITRVREAANLARRYPKATIVLSGPSDAETALARSDGAFLSRLVLDLRARNTFENAWNSKELARPDPRQRWLLVTSAVHMPRAMTAFCSVGFQVEPWPVHDTPTESRDAAQQVQHEILGLIAYRLLGRTRFLVWSPIQRCA